MATVDQKIATAVAALLPKALTVAARWVSNISSELNYSIKKAHIDYATSIVKKYAKAKTFLIRSESVDLHEFYVPASVDSSEGRIEQVNLARLLKLSKRVLVIGGGGTGKTILVRHLLLDGALTGSHFPILIELRNLNDQPDRTLMAEISGVLKGNGFNLDDGFIQKSFSDGYFTLLLDGFDELQYSKRKSVELEIDQLAVSTDCQIVITSRPDSALQAWDRFRNVKISPLTLEEACLLVEKAIFDSDVKKKLIASLKSGLFLSHKFFLSNPLLLSIMLLTYGDSAEIPNRRSTFYKLAYDALFHQHDALKSSFRRERNVQLDIYEFAKLFSAFCIATYYDRALRFSREDAVKYIKKSSAIVGLSEISSEGFLDDARQAVCLIVDEGVDYVFTHRSFQEYFAARFIAEAGDDWKRKAIRRIASTSFRQDSVIDLLYEMDQPCVEEYLFIPELENFFGEYSAREIDKEFVIKTFVLMFKKIEVSVYQVVTFHRSNDSMHAVVDFVRHNYLKRELPIVDRDFNKIKKKEFVRKFGTVAVFSPESYSSDIVELACDISVHWNVETLELIRRSFVDMRSRLANRREALGDIF